MSTDSTLKQPLMKKPLSVFSLVMINVIAIDNLRTLPFSAEFGLGLVGIYALAAICFLVPVGLVSAELATTWPSQGGLYVWIRTAFGAHWGLFIIWLQWIYNVVWYPTALAFVMGTIGYIIHPAWMQDKSLFLLCIVAMFWLATFANCFGMKISGALSTIGALVGTLIPMGLIIALAAIWLAHGHPCHIQWSWQSLWPTSAIQSHWPFLVEVIFGLVGLEMSAMHADQVHHPQSAYPKAIAWSIIIIFTTLVLASLGLAMVIPHNQLNVITGISQALTVFLTQYHLAHLHPLLSALIVIGGLGGVAAWIIGPTKGLLIAAKDGLAPQALAKTNRHGVPTRILLLQALLFTLFASFYIWMPDLQSAYILLTAMTTQLSLLVYVGLFLAAWSLRTSHAKQHRPYRVSKGNFGLKSCCLLGLITCLTVIALGFIPPQEYVSVKAQSHYIIILVLGMLGLCLPPLIMSRLSHKSAA